MLWALAAYHPRRASAGRAHVPRLLDARPTPIPPTSSPGLGDKKRARVGSLHITPRALLAQRRLKR